MSLFEAIILGIIEGFTEFLPISSTAHLTITEKLFGYTINSADITAFTAIVQVGAVLATLLYFRRDLWQLLTSLLKGFRNRQQRDSNYRFAWAIALGSIPIGIVGLLFKHEIETTLRSLWFVAFALLTWSAVMWLADHYATQQRHEDDVNWRDTLIIGITQCLALIPGVSRSAATMSAGLLRGLDRVTATRLAFFLSIPALTAAGFLQTITKFNDVANGVGWTATLAATAASFVVAYLAVAWLLKFIANHSYQIFITYRLALGTTLLILLSTGVISAT